MSTFESVAEFSLTLAPIEIPQNVMDRAALLLLDTLGVAIAAAPMQAGRIARETAFALYGASSVEKSAQMLLDGRRVSPAGAAFAMATQTDNLDAHDGYNLTKGHIGCAVVPALFSIAQQMEGLTGRDALAAMVIGYEIAGRAGQSLHATVADYHTSGSWNALGVAALGARLRGLSPEQLRHALGIAEYHGPRSQMMREIATPTMLHDGSGMGALVGVSAVTMAELGFTGAPAITLEGKDVSAFWTDLGKRWIVLDQYIKPYPICRWAHAAIDAARSLMVTHGLQASEIASVHINTFHESAQLFSGMPDTTSKAQYSLGFAVAVMIVHGRIGMADITGDGLTDARVAKVLSKITVSETARHNDPFPARRTADVVIETRDGRRLESGVTSGRGGAAVPIDAGEIEAKFLQFASPVLGRDRARQVLEAVLDLHTCRSNFSDVTALLVGPDISSS